MNIEDKTIEELVNEYLIYAEFRKKRQSYLSIRKRIQFFLNDFKDYKLKEITPTMYFEFQKKISKKGYRNAYYKSIHYSVNSFYSYLATFFDYSNNIPKKVGFSNINEDYHEMEYFNIKEFNSFINTFESKELVYKTLFEFLFYTGCRIGEALALNYNDLSKNIIFINKTIAKEYYRGKRIITSPKTKGSIRKIIIDDELLKKILLLKEKYKNKFNSSDEEIYIFGGNKPLSPSTIERKKNEHCKIAKLKQIRIHDFRHSHATLLLEKGIPIIEVSHRLGHGDINTTIKTYAHLTKDYEKRVLDTLNSIHTN